jgi:hypothetical protein
VALDTNEVEGGKVNAVGDKQMAFDPFDPKSRSATRVWFDADGPGVTSRTGSDVLIRCLDSQAFYTNLTERA